MSRYISSLSNPKVKEIVQLVSKSKVRKVFGVCIVEGRREVDRALACNWEMKELWTLENTEPVAGVPDTVDRYEVSAKVYERSHTVILRKMLLLFFTVRIAVLRPDRRFWRPRVASLLLKASRNLEILVQLCARLWPQAPERLF